MSFEISHCLNRLAPICDLGGAGGLFRVPIFDAISEQFKFVKPNLYLVHLFAIEDGQSSKLFERRSKTRHTSQSWCREIGRCA